MKNKIIVKLIALCMSGLILINNCVKVNAKLPLYLLESSIEKISSSCTDEEYIAEALNLLTPYVYKTTGITENFRLYNGSINSIKIDKILGKEDVLGRLYNRDLGKGSADMMRCLFPSSAGSLNSQGGSERSTKFTEDCNPTPELIAKISSYLYKIRNGNIKVNENLIQIDEGRVSKKDFLKEYFDCDVKVKRKNEEEKTLFDLLKNMTYMIQNEENEEEKPTNDDIEKGKILPKYTTEHMLMSYFIEHFNDEDSINIFYDTIKNEIKLNREIDSEIKEQIYKLNNLKKLINLIPLYLYTSDPIENGSTKSMELNSTRSFLDIGESIFQDCSDISARHIMNFLLYDNMNEMFSLVLDNVDEKQIELDLERLKKEVDKNGTFEFKSLKERLQLFYLYQTKDKVNDGSLFARTLWNYVISNMNDEIKMKSLNMYPIKYVDEKSYELETGIINSLKLYYNIAYALKGEEHCKKAKECIDEFLQDIRNKDNFKKAMEETLKILNSSVSVDICDDYNFSHSEVYGTIKIKIGDQKSKDEFCIFLFQDEGHGSVKFKEGYNKIVIDENFQKEVNQDKIARLLLYKFNGDKNQEISLFDKLYINKQEVLEKREKSSYEKKIESLKFFKEFQGEEKNEYRFFDRINQNVDFLEGAKLICVNKSEQISLFDFIYDRYCFDLDSFLKDDKIYNVIKERIQEKNGAKYVLKNDNTCFVYDFDENNINKNLIILNNIEFNDKEYKVTSIGAKAFNCCEKLEKVTIPKNINIIGYSAFESCNNLKEINFVEVSQLISIESHAFYGCMGLKIIKRPKKLASVVDPLFSSFLDIKIKTI